jgi:hypothetical protein
MLIGSTPRIYFRVSFINQLTDLSLKIVVLWDVKPYVKLHVFLSKTVILIFKAMRASDLTRTLFMFTE